MGPENALVSGWFSPAFVTGIEPKSGGPQRVQAGMGVLLDDIFKHGRGPRWASRSSGVPGDIPYCYPRSTTCAGKAHIGIGFSVPASVLKPSPRSINRQPTPTKVPMKKGPEIIDFRPSL